MIGLNLSSIGLSKKLKSLFEFSRQKTLPHCFLKIIFLNKNPNYLINRCQSYFYVKVESLILTCSSLLQQKNKSEKDKIFLWELFWSNTLDILNSDEHHIQSWYSSRKAELDSSLPFVCLRSWNWKPLDPPQRSL